MEFNTDVFAVPDTTLIYEYQDAYSSATGDCAGMFIDRWYGSEMSYENIVKSYEKKFLDDGNWALRPEDATRIWRKQTQNELFSISIEAFTNQNESNPLHVYDLPDSLLQATTNYSTVYGISLSYMSKYSAKKCFEK